MQDYFQKTKGLSRAPRKDDRTPEAGLRFANGDPGDNVINRGAELDALLTQEVPPMALKLVNPPRFATSYSGIKSFLNCPYRWAAEKYYKTVQFVEGPEAAEGNHIHTAFENIIKGAPAAGDIELIKGRGWAHYLKAIFGAIKAGALVQAEKELCFTKDMQPCGWRDWNTVWFRFKGDVLIHKAPKIFYFDWKSGKRFSKRGDDQADELQLKIAWAVIALHHPEMEEFVGNLIYLKEPTAERAIYQVRYNRSHLSAIWEELLSITGRMEEAWASGVFRQCSSGLCRAHCDVMDCAHNGRRG